MTTVFEETDVKIERRQDEAIETNKDAVQLRYATLDGQRVTDTQRPLLPDQTDF